MKYIVNLGGFPPDLKWYYNFYESIDDDKKSQCDVINHYLQREPVTAVFYTIKQPNDSMGPIDNRYSVYLEFASEDEFLAFKLRWS